MKKYDMPIGTKYVMLNGEFQPINDLTGEQVVNCFYPAGSTKGYFIFTRTATVRERGEEIKANAEAAPKAHVPTSLPALTDLWK